jgi:hypothetical protein
MSTLYELRPSTRKEKKWMITTPQGKIIHFGASGYDDFTIHRNIERMNNYTSRHKPRENWNKSGINSAGFWSKWLLWNKPSLTSSIRDTEQRFNIKIVKKR